MRQQQHNQKNEVLANCSWLCLDAALFRCRWFADMNIVQYKLLVAADYSTEH